MVEKLSRKRLRLKHYDYSQEGLYFVTICTIDRKPLLSSVVGDDAHIVPKRYGAIAKKYVDSIQGIDSYVIMPNHIHMIIRVDGGSMWASTPTKSISQRVKSFKILVTKEIGYSIFQRSFYDHIIRDEKDYLKHLKYIDENPIKWKYDELYKE